MVLSKTSLADPSLNQSALKNFRLKIFVLQGAGAMWDLVADMARQGHFSYSYLFAGIGGGQARLDTASEMVVVYFQRENEAI